MLTRKQSVRGFDPNEFGQEGEMLADASDISWVNQLVYQSILSSIT